MPHLDVVMTTSLQSMTLDHSYHQVNWGLNLGDGDISEEQKNRSKEAVKVQYVCVSGDER